MKIVIMRVLLLALLPLIIGGCTDAERVAQSDEAKAAQPGGAELWAHSCRRCHAVPAPTAYSADQWEVVANHMRIRAGLTAKDARKIEAFLKAAN